MFADGNIRKSKTNVDSCYGWADRSCQSSGKEEGCGYNLRCDTEWLYYADDDREKCVVEGVSTENHHERYGVVTFFPALLIRNPMIGSKV